MPEFSEYVYIDVSPEEFITSCNRSELKELKELLSEQLNPQTIVEEEWEDSLRKLMNNKIQLTREEEEIILKMANKIVV